MIRTETYTLPAFWACPLFYGDDTGLDDEEMTILDRFVQVMVRAHGLFQAIECSDEAFFARHHDASPDVLACNCLEFTFQVSRGGEIPEPETPAQNPPEKMFSGIAARAIEQGRALYQLDPAYFWLAGAALIAAIVSGL